MVDRIVNKHNLLKFDQAVTKQNLSVPIMQQLHCQFHHREILLECPSEEKNVRYSTGE